MPPHHVSTPAAIALLFREQKERIAALLARLRGGG